MPQLEFNAAFHAGSVIALVAARDRVAAELAQAQSQPFGGGHPDLTRFSVSVNGQAATVIEAVLEHHVFLRLAADIPAGATVTVSYSDSADDQAQGVAQDGAGQDVASTPVPLVSREAPVRLYEALPGAVYGLTFGSEFPDPIYIEGDRDPPVLRVVGLTSDTVVIELRLPTLVANPRYDPAAESGYASFTHVGDYARVEVVRSAAFSPAVGTVVPLLDFLNVDRGTEVRSVLVGTVVADSPTDPAGTVFEIARYTYGGPVPLSLALIGSGWGSDRVEGSPRRDVLWPGGSGDDTLRGQAGDDDVAGGFGRDLIEGGPGNDLVHGGPGDDTLDGGAILDTLFYGDGNTLSYFNSPAAVQVNLRTGQVQDGWGTVDTVRQFTFFIGSEHADTFIGSDGPLFEMFAPGPGNDTVDGGTISATSPNRINYSAAPSGVTVNLASGTSSGPHGVDTLIQINQVRGSRFDDRLTGSDRTDFWETFESWGGNDTIDGAGGDDEVRYDRLPARAVVVNLALGKAENNQAGTDQLIGIEHVRGTAFGDMLVGSARANRLRGLEGDDTLEGGAGDDTLEGGDGQDTVRYAGPRRDYQVQWLPAEGLYRISSVAEGTDQLLQVEKLVFADQTLATASLHPAVTLTADTLALKPGQGARITFTLSEPVTDFTAADVTVTGGTLNQFSGSGRVYIALYVPTPNSPVLTAVSVGSSAFTSAAGILNIDGSDDDNRLSFGLERSFSAVEGQAFEAALPPGAQVTGIWKQAFINRDGSLTAPTDWGRPDVDDQGRLRLPELGQFNGVILGPTSAGDVRITYAAAPDPVVVLVSESGRFRAPPSIDYTREVTLLPDGRALMAGGFTPLANGPLGLQIFRLSPEGVLDRSYGVDGLARVPNFQLFATKLQPDGKLLVAGVGNPGHLAVPSGELIRFNSDGSLDTGFGVQGRLSVPWGGFNAWLQAVDLMDDGRIVVVGRAAPGPTGMSNDIGVARYLPNGTLDPSFDQDGWTLLNLGGVDRARGVSVLPDGRIAVAGSTTVNGSLDFMMLRLTAGGILDSSFGSGGVSILTRPATEDSNFGAFVRLKSGQYVMAGPQYVLGANGAPLDGRGLITRFNADGSLDLGFGANGVVELDLDRLPGVPVPAFAEIFERSDGDLVLAGTYEFLDEPLPELYQSLVVQLQANGSLDTTFGEGGLVFNNAGQILGGALRPDGRFLYGGFEIVQSVDAGLNTKIQLLPTGQLDPSFNPTPTFKPGGPPVALNHLVSIFDADASAFNGGPAVSYADHQVVLQRAGLASADDRFGGTGPLELRDTTAGAVDAGAILVGGLSIGQYTQAAGRLVLDFNENATQARVDAALSNLTYAHTGRAAPAELALTVSVTDGTSSDSATLDLINAAGSSGSQSVAGLVYHWKSHVLLSEVTLRSGDQKAVQADADLFDLREARFDPASRTLTVQLWMNPNQPASSFDFSALSSGATAASFTSALSPSTWTVLANTEQAGSVLVSGFISNLTAPGVTTAQQLGTLSLTLAPDAPVSLAFRHIAVGGSTAADALLSITSQTTAADGRYALDLGSSGTQALTVSRPVGDGSHNNGITAADALAALRMAVGLNPNADPDGAGPLSPLRVSPYQIMAADANGDGRITSLDALAILKMSVRLGDAPAPEWLFVEEDRDFWDEGAQAFTLTRSQAAWDRAVKISLPTDATTHLVGVLKGDVNGSWTLPGAPTVQTLDPDHFKKLAALIGVPEDQWGLPPGG